VALKAVKSLEQIVGTASLFTGGASTPLTQALSYPDRLVRFEAAYTVGSSMPSQPFPGSNQVVPTLAEMIAQTGKPGVLVVAKTDADVAKWSEAFKGLGYNVVGGTTPEAALGMSNQIPSVDAVVISEEAGLGAVDSLLAASATSPKVAIRYQPFRNIAFRASYGEGFLAPTPNQVLVESSPDCSEVFTGVDPFYPGQTGANLNGSTSCRTRSSRAEP
jgi:hypothetical protein